MKNNGFKRTGGLLFLSICLISIVNAQTILEADGPGNTYELINRVLAPGYDAVEHPECAHPEFGRHITEVWDDELKQYVFEFHIHVAHDNDRCKNYDRQRMEIKTYASSPAQLIGVVGETVEYKWKFRLPVGFKPSSKFTHLHQIKPVGGDDSEPLFTLTARKGSPNKMELIHNNTDKVRTVNLSLFEGQWVEVTEKIKIDPINGTYSMEIRNLSTGASILSYANNQLMTIRPNNDFIRPKWGIYRSLINSVDLRDEIVRFAGFSIREENTSSSANSIGEDRTFLSYMNLASRQALFEYYVLNGSEAVKLDVYDVNGQLIRTLVNREVQDTGHYQYKFDMSSLNYGIYLARLSLGTNSQTVKLIYSGGG